MDTDELFYGEIESTLRETGISKGQHVLDCCCGPGTYTIPAAMLVGEEGLVYAVDEDNAKLRKLKTRAESLGIRNIRIIRQNVELEIPLPDETVDFVLLYDTFWYFRPAEKKTRDLLKEVARVARTKAAVSVYPTHIDKNGLRIFNDTMKENGFELKNEVTRRLVHESSLVTGTLLTYKKA